MLQVCGHINHGLLPFKFCFSANRLMEKEGPTKHEHFPFWAPLDGKAPLIYSVTKE